MAKKQKKTDNVLARNRRASHEYIITEKFEAGLELQGTEVKSCREGNVSLAEGFVRIENGEIFLHNVHIAVYEHGNIFNHDPKRTRKLLLHKREILKLSQKVKERGFTIVPLKFYLARGKVKVEIALCKGKTYADKRETLRRKQDDMDARRAISASRGRSV